MDGTLGMRAFLCFMIFTVFPIHILWKTFYFAESRYNPLLFKENKS